MNTSINTIARFLISTFYIADGILLMSSIKHIDFTTTQWFSFALFTVGCIELLSGMFLFLGYKKPGSAILLIICTLFTTLFLRHSLFELLNNLALAASLMLIINNNSGVTFWKYVQTDINDLPDYKVKM